MDENQERIQTTDLIPSLYGAVTALTAELNVLKETLRSQGIKIDKVEYKRQWVAQIRKQLESRAKKPDTEGRVATIVLERFDSIDEETNLSDP